MNDKTSQEKAVEVAALMQLPWLTKEQTARVLQTSVRNVSRKMRAREIPFQRLGSFIRIVPEELRQAMQSRTNSARK